MTTHILLSNSFLISLTLISYFRKRVRGGERGGGGVYLLRRKLSHWVVIKLDRGGNQLLKFPGTIKEWLNTIF